MTKQIPLAGSGTPFDFDENGCPKDIIDFTLFTSAAFCCAISMLYAVKCIVL